MKTSAVDLIASLLIVPGMSADLSVRLMTRRPKESFRAILAFKEPYPAGVHRRDVHETHLLTLLTRLLGRCPGLLDDLDLSELGPGQRYMILAAAIGSEEPRFDDLVLEGLEDRSIYVKLLVVDAIGRDGHLRKAGVRQRLRRLIALPSIAASDHDRERIERALEAFDT